MSPLDDQRDDLIARIKAVSPKNPPRKWKYEFNLTSPNSIEANRLEHVLSGKRWEVVIDAPDIVPIFTDVDYASALLAKAFRYYLPAFLVAILKTPYRVDNGYRWFFEKFWHTRDKFSLDELEIVLAVLNYQRERMDNDDWEVDQLETAQLRLIYYLEERRK
jgi:hypothetical protein